MQVNASVATAAPPAANPTRKKTLRSTPVFPEAPRRQVITERLILAPNNRVAVRIPKLS